MAEEIVYIHIGLRSLPPELWIRIFELASVPGILDIDVPHPFPPPVLGPPKHHYDLEALKRSLQTRRSITLVCQAWYTMALEMLYQVVFLSGAKASSIENSVQCFRRTLVDFDDSLWPHQSRGRRANPGRYTRHLLLESITGPLCQKIPAITIRLPNVAILTIIESSLTDDFGWTLFTGNFARSLRRINYCPDPYKTFPEKVFVDILRASTRLRTLIVDDRRPVFSLKLPRLNDLQFLAGIQGQKELQPEGSPLYPALRHVYTRGERWTGSLRDQFFESQGRALTTLSLDLRMDPARDFSIEPTNGARRGHLAWSNVSPLWHHCPSLTHIHLIYDWSQLADLAAFALPFTMTHLGIFITLPHKSFSTVSLAPNLEGLLNEITALGSKHATLTTIRFTNADFVEWLREAVTAKSSLPSKLLLLQCMDHFRVEDYTGAEMTF
ncbi:hypothetical protein OF83DRAFT_412127 [Amylostereum chailletii]|nr:hypothetical protein OF83DRAFT_412127 [Amylostereum chailletii]